MTRTHTHTATYALLEVSDECFEEIAAKLRDAGYFAEAEEDYGEDYGRVINMRGLALVKAPKPKT